MSIEEDTPLWSVDRSWSNYRGNANGELAPSDLTKSHIDRGDSTAKCSSRILLNSLDSGIYADQPTGTVGELERQAPGIICRRCVPNGTKS